MTRQPRSARGERTTTSPNRTVADPKEIPACSVAPGLAHPDEGAHEGSDDGDAAREPGIELPSGVVLDVRSIMLTGLLVIAAVAALYFAKPVVMPVVLAALLSFLLAPIVSLLGRFRIPPALAAAIVLAAVIAVVAGGISQLITPVTEWMEALPAQLEKIEGELRNFRRPIESVERATAQVEGMAVPDSPAPAAEEPVQVEVRGESITDIILTELRGVAVLLILIITLLYFLLASGDRFLQKLVKVQDSLSRKKLAVDIVRQIKSDVSTYLLAITLINGGLGVATGLAMYFLGMPNPLLWGVMAAVFNYIPYLGAVVGAAVIGLAAAAQFDSLGEILLVPAVFLTLTTLEGYIVTPLVLGARLTLSPVVIFIGLLFWGWLWGVPGALIAVPMLVTMKIICDRVETLQPVGEFLGQ